MRFNVVSQSLIGIARRYDTTITPAERAEPAAPECFVGEDAVDVAAPHAPIITATAIDLVTGIVSAPCNPQEIRRDGWGGRSAHMNFVASDRHIGRPRRMRAPFNPHSSLVGSKDGCDR